MIGIWLVLLLAVCVGLTVLAEEPTDLSKAVRVNSTNEAVNALKKARANHQEEVILYVNPSKVPIENEKEGWADVHSSIYREFHYGYAGGLYNAMDYDVFSGPSVDTMGILREDGSMEWTDFYEDEANPGYGYYRIVFQYHDNAEELAQADAKIKSVLQKVSGKSDAEKVIYVYDYLKENLPKEKLSNSGYPRNCNGVYGALFGDGTGYVCSTYACTIQRFMELANIPSYIIGGAYEKGEPNHAINVVRLSGKWYVVDYTQDALLIGTEDYSRYHSFSDLVKKYMSSYSMAKETYDQKSQDTKPSGASLGKVNLKSAGNAGYNSVTLKWNKVKNAKGYEIYYSAKKSSGYKKLATVKSGNTTSYKAKKLTTGKKYYFKVRAYSGTKKGSFSRVLSAKPLPAKAAITRAVNLSGKKISLSWKKVSGASGYEVYYKSGNGAYRRLKTLSRNKLTAGGRFSKGKKYTFKVRAYRTVNKKKVYGSFSTAKSIMIRK